MSAHHYTYPKVVPVPRPGPLASPAVSGTKQTSDDAMRRAA